MENLGDEKKEVKDIAQTKNLVNEDACQVTPLRPFMFLGKDLSQIPCFRDSFIVGFCGGIGVGLLCFLFTSKVRLSSHVAMGSTFVGIYGYWFPCRHKYETTRRLMEM